MMRIPFTNEPGSWVMFAIAFAVGTAKADRVDIFHLVIFISLSLFLAAKAPVGAVLKKKDKAVLPYVGAYIVIGLAGCLYSVVKQPSLAILYGAGLPLIVLYFLLNKKGFPVLSEASGMAMMGLAASIAASIHGESPPKLYLWAMFFLFYLASSFRVRFTIRKFRILSGIYSGILVSLGVLIAVQGRLLFLSFLPLIEDIYSSISGRKEDFKRLGIIESVKSLIFGLLIVMS